MWVIYDTDTGIELDRIYDKSTAQDWVAYLNSIADYDHYTMRWEA